MKLFIAIATFICLQLSAAQICLCGEGAHGLSIETTPSACCHQSQTDEAPDSCPHCDKLISLVLILPEKVITAPDSEGFGLLPALVESFPLYSDSDAWVVSQRWPTSLFSPFSGGRARALLGVFLI